MIKSSLVMKINNYIIVNYEKNAIFVSLLEVTVNLQQNAESNLW